MRILVVEDESVMGRALTQGLAELGYLVDLAHDGHEGLWRGVEGDYAAIVLDLRLPGINGYRVCEELRQRGVTTPVLVLTALTADYDEAEALDLGADDFLRKPFSLVVLASRLRALIRRGSVHADPGTSETLTAGDLALVPATGSCSRAGRPVSLTPRERDLLEVLLRQRGAVLTRQSALQQVWGLDYDGDGNVVEVYVGYLRRKLDRAFPDRPVLIHTVRGIGYRLQPAEPAT